VSLRRLRLLSHRLGLMIRSAGDLLLISEAKRFPRASVWRG
jgi:hypothetical protein